jgi:hypothetical protein
MNILSRLWEDDTGAVISTELIMVVGVATFGTIPGLVAARNSMTSSFQKIGNNLQSVVPDPETLRKQIEQPANNNANTNQNYNVNHNVVNVHVVVPSNQSYAPPAP